MKNKLEILILCLCCQFCFSQISDRKPLHGQVVNDSIQLENGSVYNINSKKRTFISPDGFFDLLAKEKDTLLFSGFAFKSKTIVLSEKDFTATLLTVKLQAFTNQLEEVIVSKKRNVGPVFDLKAIADMKFFDDEKSSPKNRLMPPDGSIENGVNFVRLFSDIVGLIKGKQKTEKEVVSDENFIEVTKQAIKHVFFTNTLKLKEDEIGLFLIFCENDSKSRKLLKPESEFELIDFLITKSKEFKSLTTFEK